MSDTLRLIEMAYDFERQSIDDLFEPEFRSALAAHGHPVILFFGTSTPHFWEIVNEGFGKQRPFKKNLHKPDTFHVELNDAVRAADISADQTGGKPLVLVVETPVLDKPEANDDTTYDLIHAAGVGGSPPMIPLNLSARHITGALYPATQTAREIPIRKFIRMVQRGDVEGADPQGDIQRGTKFNRATDIPWQQVAVYYLQDMLNYTRASMFEWIAGRGNEFNQKVLSKLAGKNFDEVAQWTGLQWYEWLVKNIGHGYEPDESEEDSYQFMNMAEFKVPFYMVYRKFADPAHFREFRQGHSR